MSKDNQMPEKYAECLRRAFAGDFPRYQHDFTSKDLWMKKNGTKDTEADEEQYREQSREHKMQMIARYGGGTKKNVSRAIPYFYKTFFNARKSIHRAYKESQAASSSKKSVKKAGVRVGEIFLNREDLSVMDKVFMATSGSISKMIAYGGKEKIRDPSKNKYGYWVSVNDTAIPYIRQGTGYEGDYQQISVRLSRRKANGKTTRDKSSTTLKYVLGDKVFSTMITKLMDENRTPNVVEKVKNKKGEFIYQTGKVRKEGKNGEQIQISLANPVSSKFALDAFGVDRNHEYYYRKDGHTYLPSNHAVLTSLFIKKHSNLPPGKSIIFDDEIPEDVETRELLNDQSRRVRKGAAEFSSTKKRKTNRAAKNARRSLDEQRGVRSPKATKSKAPKASKKPVVDDDDVQTDEDAQTDNSSARSDGSASDDSSARSTSDDEREPSGPARFDEDDS